MSQECQECQDFLGHVQRHYQALLDQHGFRMARCSAEDGGRECLFMYESARCRLLFMLSDGAQACLIGSLDTPFPGNVMLYGNGDYGWYHIVALIEQQTGKRLLTRRLTDEFASGERDFFAWESQLFAGWADRLCAMLAPGAPQTWREDFQRYVQSRG